MPLLLKNCRIVNAGEVREGDIRIVGERIAAIGALTATAADEVTDVDGRYVLPGAIDDQVHFREPGLTHKADIATESRAAVAGGVTSFMEMPNVKPPTLTMALLEEKRAIAARAAMANYAFYLGAGNDNLEAIKAADANRIAGIKIFMGASTGNLLVDEEAILEKIFAAAPTLIATHCENNTRVVARLQEAVKEYGDNIPAAAHATIRDDVACYESSERAIRLARQTGARLHILHITTAKELDLFTPGPPEGKQITCEACAHHLLFDADDYAALGMRLKCNPAVKTRADRDAIRRAVAESRIDVLATDHAPHLPAEKDRRYTDAQAGLPLVEYALPAFMQLVADGALTVADVARSAAHRVADIFAVRERGYIREGYYADLAVLDEAPADGDGFPARATVLSKCGWTPFADYHFRYRVAQTFVNGVRVWNGQSVAPAPAGMALTFAR